MLREFMTERDVGAGQRIAGDIDRGIAAGSAHDSAQALHEARSSHAAPLYEEAFKANQNIASPRVDRMLKTPAGRKALGDARVKMQNDMTLLGRPDPELTAQAREAGQIIKGGR